MIKIKVGKSVNFKITKRKHNFIKIYNFKYVDSTNNVAQKMADSGCSEGVVVTATEQTAGKGRLGRTFVSKRGGLYFSLVIRPNIAPSEMLFITVAAAVAAARAIEFVSGKKCEIKWVNDIYIDGKKVCGILTEGAFNTDGTLKYVVLGVGINMFRPKGGFGEMLPLADSVFGEKKGLFFKKLIKKQVLNEFLNVLFDFYDELGKKSFVKEYQKRSFLQDKQISYTQDGKTYSAKVAGIDDEGRLVVKHGEEIKKISHGEIQIVGMEQPEI